VFEHAAHDTVGALAVLSNLREIAFQGRRQFVDFGLLVACNGIVGLWRTSITRPSGRVPLNPHVCGLSERARQ
jgi:hypothetical protein